MAQICITVPDAKADAIADELAAIGGRQPEETRNQAARRAVVELVRTAILARRINDARRQAVIDAEKTVTAEVNIT